MLLKHRLLEKQKSRTASADVQIDLYPLATELFCELDKIGVIQRMKEIPQLGIIRVNKKMKKSRYDYIILQLYFHQLIRKEKSLQQTLEYSYGGTVKAHAFKEGMQYLNVEYEPSIADLLQILTISYNIGHFYNTFVSSRAVVMFANENKEFRKAIIESSESEIYRNIANRLLNDMNYRRYHLLNSLMILQHCDQSKASVQIAQELIYAYLNEDSLHTDSKLHYVFYLYRTVRNVAYISYDLQIANTPLTVDLCNKHDILVIFEELLSKHNDNRSMEELIKSLSKLLNDTLYNEEAKAICYYMVSKTMVNKLNDFSNWNKESYYSLLENKESVLNRHYRKSRDFVQDGILKLTFKKEHRAISQKLLYELNHTHCISVGYYDRNNDEQTILVSIKRNCENKKTVALRVLRIVIKHLRLIPNIKTEDTRYLLTTKFFLFYFLGEYPLIIKPTIHPEICVICTKGNARRISAIQKLIQNHEDIKNENHEADNICQVLKDDRKNDVCITIPSSITLYEKNKDRSEFCEFDGMIIFPNRPCNQIVFLEAKNTREKPIRGKKDLSKKLSKLNIPYERDAIQIIGKDAVCKVYNKYVRKIRNKNVQLI